MPALAFTGSPWAAVLVAVMAAGLALVVAVCAAAVIKVKRECPDATLPEVAAALAELLLAVLRGRRDT